MTISPVQQVLRLSPFGEAVTRSIHRLTSGVLTVDAPIPQIAHWFSPSPVHSFPRWPTCTRNALTFHAQATTLLGSMPPLQEAMDRRETELVRLRADPDQWPAETASFSADMAFFRHVSHSLVERGLQRGAPNTGIEVDDAAAAAALGLVEVFLEYTMGLPYLRGIVWKTFHRRSIGTTLLVDVDPSRVRRPELLDMIKICQDGRDVVVWLSRLDNEALAILNAIDDPYQVQIGAGNGLIAAAGIVKDGPTIIETLRERGWQRGEIVRLWGAMAAGGESYMEDVPALLRESVPVLAPLHAVNETLADRVKAAAQAAHNDHDIWPRFIAAIDRSQRHGRPADEIVEDLRRAEERGHSWDPESDFPVLITCAYDTIEP